MSIFNHETACCDSIRKDDASRCLVCTKGSPFECVHSSIRLAIPSRDVSATCVNRSRVRQSYRAPRAAIDERTGKTINYIALAIFAPVLIIAGIAGFLVPPEASLTSGAPAYNVFHLVFGAIGLLLVIARKEPWLSLFNFGFGLIDLYQALASVLHLPPEEYFLWTKVDDILHVVIGLALVMIGGYGLRKHTAMKGERT